MELKKLISQLQKARKGYVNKHGKEPIIYSFPDNYLWDEEPVQLASSKVEGKLGTTFKRPYMDFNIEEK